jgi:hypothetical protein
MTNEGIGRFAAPLRVEFLPGGRLARILEEFIYVAPTGRHWPSPAGLIFDGASIPQLFWIRFGGPFDGPNVYIGAVHDPRYRLGDCTKDEADHLLLDVARCAGFSDEDAEALYLGVHFGGGSAWAENAAKRATCGSDMARLLAWV